MLGLTSLRLTSIQPLFIAIFLSFTIYSSSYADDTEIFFGQAPGAVNTNPNFMFVLDISGSMANTDRLGISRLARMQNTLKSVIDQSPKINMGVMTFQGTNSGAAVRYPVRPLERSSSSANAALIDVIDDLPPRGLGQTPTVESLLEAANYMIGRRVDYGNQRGRFGDELFRVSHPGSYTGGSVSRDSGCTDQDLNAPPCEDEEILNSPTNAVYTSPIENQCQSNHIVLLSDGGASSNNAERRIQSLIGSRCDNATDRFDRCGPELAQWLQNSDIQPRVPGKQTVTTHTIAYNFTGAQNLIDISQASGGLHLSAVTSTELLDAINEIIGEADQPNISFVAPAASISQFNRLRNNNDLYYAMFRPSINARWEGNLKRYELAETQNSNFEIVDSRGNNAIDPISGNFLPSSQSFWSTVADGDQVALGGVAEQLNLGYPDNTLRNVYTFNRDSGITDLVASANSFDPSNTLLNRAALDLPPLVANDSAEVSKIISWARGADLEDINGNGSTSDTRPTIGDPMHSTPLVTHYADGESVIYMATNEGFLHALDTDTGNEHFAFIPEELYKNIYSFYTNNPTNGRPYGLDGGKTLWHEDTDNDGLIDTNETAILYVGMRRGGDSYFALDVSNYKTPKYLWSIKGGQRARARAPRTIAKGDYRKLGSTWSLPVKTKIVHRSVVRDVIIFGGGYDEENQDPAGNTVVNGVSRPIVDIRTVDNIGQAIFIADAETGNLLWQSTSSADFSKMLYSVPSEVRTIDINSDGIVDQLYVGDTGGQLWRADIDNSLSSGKRIGQRISAGVIAEVAGNTEATNRKFYYPPDVSVIDLQGEQSLTISIGTGWRAHPLDTIINERFYSFRSPDVFGPPTDSSGAVSYTTVSESSNGLIDITDEIDVTLDNDALGWYLRFDQPGEKVLAPSVTFNNQLIFTSYLPSSSGSSCNASIGGGRAYVLNIFNGSPIQNLDEVGDDDNLTRSDRARVLTNPGIPPGVSVLFPETNSASESTPTPLFQVGKEIIEGFNSGTTSQSTFWQEITENHDE